MQKGTTFLPFNQTLFLERFHLMMQLLEQTDQGRITGLDQTLKHDHLIYQLEIYNFLSKLLYYYTITSFKYYLCRF